MKTVLVIALASLFIATPGIAVDPWYVTTDIPMEAPKYWDTNDNWTGQKEFWKQWDACANDNGTRLAVPYRVPQFWDSSGLTVELELEWRYENRHPDCPSMRDPASIAVEIRFARPSAGFINGGEVGEYPTDSLLVDAVETVYANRDVRYNPSFTYYYNQSGLDVSPGEMLRFEFRAKSNLGSALCQCMAPLAIRHLRIKAPVVLPFIFENGFEEGQGAFWSALYGGM
jgi:hypothetical protein